MRGTKRFIDQDPKQSDHSNTFMVIFRILYDLHIHIPFYSHTFSLQDNYNLVAETICIDRSLFHYSHNTDKASAQENEAPAHAEIVANAVVCRSDWITPYNWKEESANAQTCATYWV